MDRFVTNVPATVSMQRVGIANRDNVLRPLDEHLSSDKCFVIKIQLNEIISIKDNVERRSRLIY